MYYNALLLMAALQNNALPVTYRHCESDADYAACVALQEATWGADDVVPMTLLKAAQKIGGIVAGAFDDKGEMLGCVFGLSGVRDGMPTHWSHMLAVMPSARGRGLAFGLKTFQRDALTHLGFDHMYWTYDPLESLNAHFNINRLGARPIEYVRDMYGDGDANLLHQGLGTDRFVVRWDFNAVTNPPDTTIANSAPVLNTFENKQWSTTKPRNERFVRIEIPADIQGLKSCDPNKARAWRTCTRECIQHCLDNGFAITGFHRDDDSRSYYVLEREH